MATEFWMFFPENIKLLLGNQFFNALMFLRKLNLATALSVNRSQFSEKNYPKR
jgi:hypothetical protein